MSKIAFITDLHFGVRNDSSVFHDYFEKFYSEQFFPYLKEHNITELIDLGDTFDRRKFISFYSLDRCESYWFNKLEQNNIHCHILIGNHVIPYKNTLFPNAIDLLVKDKYSNIVSVSKPTELTIGSTNFLLVPWICDSNKDEIFTAIKQTKASVCLGHFELNGFTMNKGDHEIEDGMDKFFLDKFDQVFSGHYHHKSSKGNITYLGCPYEITWSDYDDPKGFHIFDTETRELTFIQNKFKMFEKIYYDDLKNNPTSSVPKNLQGKYLKVVVINKQNPYTFDTFLNIIEEQGPQDIQIVEQNQDMITDNTDEELLDQAEGTIDIIGKYIESFDCDCDKTELLSLMKLLHSEALTLDIE